MASLLANGTISGFSPKPTYDSHNLPKGFHPKPQIPKFPNFKTPTSRLFKVRADVWYSGQGTSSNLSSAAPGKSSISTTTTTPSASEKIQEILRNIEYDKKFGFNIDIDSYSIPKGLSKETIRLISSLKEEPDWMLEFRLNAYEKFLKMKEPKWSDNQYPLIDFQDICYYSAPRKKPALNSLEEADPELIRYFDKLGVPLNEQNRLANVAVDAVLDSVSIATTHRKTLEKAGVIFCSISEAIREYPDLVRKYLGRVVPSEDNYYAALNSAVFSDGSFCYIPKDTKCPMQISTYFRINALETGQFERRCTAPSYDRNQLHAAVVELYCAEDAQIKYSTVQNWYAGDEEGNGGFINLLQREAFALGIAQKYPGPKWKQGLPSLGSIRVLFWR
ncbi:upf0051 protein abci8 [Quercus suber]|uniref:Upf0051 protein abci8 n=1 Tax=Quercus suber TaxID=58331 RepID=A0AAW0KCI0_QUESU